MENWCDKSWSSTRTLNSFAVRGSPLITGRKLSQCRESIDERVKVKNVPIFTGYSQKNFFVDLMTIYKNIGTVYLSTFLFFLLLYWVRAAFDFRNASPCLRRHLLGPLGVWESARGVIDITTILWAVGYFYYTGRRFDSQKCSQATILFPCPVFP